MMDGDIKKDILDVRKVIERSTSKVSLRDLEKKGFRKVKVLRAGDINQLIYKAVQTVLAKQPAGMGEAEREQILNQAKLEYEAQTKRLQELQEAQDRLEGEKGEVEAKALQVEEAKKRLEQKVAELNAQLVAERNKMQAEKAAFAEEKKQLEREKQSLYEKGFDAVKTQQLQVQELQQKLNEAQAKLNGAVPADQYNQLHSEARERVAGLEKKAEELERQLRAAKADAEFAETRVEKMQARLAELESAPKTDGAEVERLKSELDAARAQITTNSAQTAEMFGALMGAIKESKTPAAAAPGDFEKSFKLLQQNLTDQLRKFAGSGAKGGLDESGAMDLGALMARQETVQLETNIKDVGVKEQSAAGVKDKLSKLRNLRAGGNK